MTNHVACQKTECGVDIDVDAEEHITTATGRVFHVGCYSPDEP